MVYLCVQMSSVLNTFDLWLCRVFIAAGFLWVQRPLYL